MTLIIDASVALKWVLDEPDSGTARELLLNDSLGAPDFLLLECANVLWTLVRRQQLEREDASAALRAVEAASVHILPTRRYIDAAQGLAFDLGQTVYDSLYLAVAIGERAVLVTADRTFVAAVMRNGRHTASVRLLQP